MTDQETDLMERYGITSELRTVFVYKTYKYGRLEDALNYARLDTSRNEAVMSKT